jgi:hypothetical protein
VAGVIGSHDRIQWPGRCSRLGIRLRVRRWPNALMMVTRLVLSARFICMTRAPGPMRSTAAPGVQRRCARIACWTTGCHWRCSRARRHRAASRGSGVVDSFRLRKPANLTPFCGRAARILAVSAGCMPEHRMSPACGDFPLGPDGVGRVRGRAAPVMGWGGVREDSLGRLSIQLPLERLSALIYARFEAGARGMADVHEARLNRVRRLWAEASSACGRHASY